MACFQLFTLPPLPPLPDQGSTLLATPGACDGLASSFADFRPPEFLLVAMVVSPYIRYASLEGSASRFELLKSAFVVSPR